MGGRALNRWLIAGLCAVLIAALTACETATPTPFPVEIPGTPTPTPEPSPRPPVRYALDPNTDGLIAEIEILRGVVLVQTLDAPVDASQMGAMFDLAAAYGTADSWQISPIMPRTGFIANPGTLTPEIARLIVSGVDGGVIAVNLPFDGSSAEPHEVAPSRFIRESMANSGLPDGVGAILGVAYAPGADLLQAQLAAFNVRTRADMMTNDAIRAALNDGRIDMALVTWANEDEAAIWRGLFGGEYLRELYTLPIRYLAVDDLAVRFTAGGWPLPDG